MLTYRSTQKVNIPHEEGEWVELKPLSWKDLDRARAERLRTVMDSVRAAGDMMASLTSMARNGTDDTPTPDDPVAAYDLGALLKAGILAWSYDAVVDQENIDSLDEDTARWIARQLVGGNKTEQDRKNGFSTSTSHSSAKGTNPKSG